MKDILFVCTANTCRSFLAEYLMESLLDEADLNLDVHSAGIFAVEDDEPTEEAVEILEKVYGIDGGKHRATPMTEEIAEESECILTMDTDLKHTLIEAYPEQEDKIYTLLEYAYGEEGLDGSLDIEDPYRGDDEDYARCAAKIVDALKAILPKLED